MPEQRLVFNEPFNNCFRSRKNTEAVKHLGKFQAVLLGGPSELPLQEQDGQGVQ